MYYFSIVIVVSVIVISVPVIVIAMLVVYILRIFRDCEYRARRADDFGLSG